MSSPAGLAAPSPGAFDHVFHSVPQEPLTILSNLGLVLLMFQIGLEFDFSHLKERVNRAAVLRISIACLVLPFTCGLALGFLLTQTSPSETRLSTALFVATALSTAADWGWCAAIVAVAGITKLGGAYFMARRSGFDRNESAIVGFMMTPAP